MYQRPQALLKGTLNGITFIIFSKTLLFPENLCHHIDCLSTFLETMVDKANNSQGTGT